MDGLWREYATTDWACPYCDVPIPGMRDEARALDALESHLVRLH